MKHATQGLTLLLAFGLSACQSLPDQAKPETLGELDIHMMDANSQPSTLNVPQAGRYRVTLANHCPVDHEVVFSNGRRLKVQGGRPLQTELDVPSSGLSFHCSLPGHRDMGMRGSIAVAGQAVAEAKPQAAPATAAPAAADYAVYDPKAPPLMLGQTHDIDLVAIEAPVAIAKGVAQQLWTYNGAVPGPVIRVKVGDTIRVHFKNPASNTLPHSVDFHASQVAWNDEMTSIKPGEEKLYEWRADYAGVWMYHCGTNPALHHIASGMYGMVIVEPREGLAPVDHEFALVQSEFYTGSHGDITDLHKAGNDKPDYVVFNGVANQYKEHPIPVETGKKVRVFVMNAGPNEDSAFHIVGTIFNRVIKEGMELKPGNTGNWGSQAVDLGPSQGAIVEFTTAEDGLYPIVTHAFNFVGKGALGLLKAGDGEPKN
ncbi:MAG TPA: multicopper oxidase domain-containing protein [Methylococcaceae bacterium]|nr:multicopper oxidase domain-containing protein [Methylococcaceae bacterium]